MQNLNIESVLSQLDNLYKYQAEETGDLLISNELLCKMAGLELCAWLEDYFDKIIMSCKDDFIKSMPKYPTDQERRAKLKAWETSIEKEINSIHGMSYSEHFRKLLVKLLGDRLVLKLEYEVGLSDIDILDKKLKKLHDYRKLLAHQTYPNIIQQRSLDAPSLLLQDFKQIYRILSRLESELKKL